MQKTYLHIKRKDDKNIIINVLQNKIIIVILQTLIISSNSYLLEYHNIKKTNVKVAYHRNTARIKFCSYWPAIDGKVLTTFTPQLLRKFFDKPIKPQKT